MGNRAMLKWIGAGALSLACLIGCGDDGGSSGSDGGGAGSGGGVAPDPLNPYCPTKVGPLDGEYGLKGDCCYRTANSTRVEEQGDGPDVEVEYRLNYIQTTNHPMSIGLELLRSIGQTRSENEEQSVLWRFTGPREGGEQASGEGTVTIGAGRYNCDGTYSYYSDTAAPDRDASKDKTRWAAQVVPIEIDVTKDKPMERNVPVWDKNTNRGLTRSPYMNSQTFELDWELVNQGYTIEAMPYDEKSLNCIGKRSESGGWEAGGTFIVYTPLDLNDKEPIAALNGQTYCQLVAFGVVPPDEISSPAYSCADVERCEPGSTDCKWIKLPDSLCPVTAEQQADWGCHVGYENNPDNEPTKCSQEAPTSTRDPKTGATDEGQCCDPLGKGTGGLPACNAYFLRNEFVAAAADITDDPVNEIQQDCE